MYFRYNYMIMVELQLLTFFFFFDMVSLYVHMFINLFISYNRLHTCFIHVVCILCFCFIDVVYWEYCPYLRGGVAQWVARLTRNVEVVGSSPIPEQETLPFLLSTGWFLERIQA